MGGVGGGGSSVLSLEGCPDVMLKRETKFVCGGFIVWVFVGWRSDGICVLGGSGMGVLGVRSGCVLFGLLFEVVGNGIVKGGDIISQVCNTVGIG